MRKEIFFSAEDLVVHALENQQDGQSPIHAAIFHISGDIYKQVVGIEMQLKAIEILKSMIDEKDSLSD